MQNIFDIIPVCSLNCISDSSNYIISDCVSCIDICAFESFLECLRNLISRILDSFHEIIISTRLNKLICHISPCSVLVSCGRSKFHVFPIGIHKGLRDSLSALLGLINNLLHVSSGRSKRLINLINCLLIFLCKAYCLIRA